MNWDKWVLDVTTAPPDPSMAAFCPYENDGTIVLGMVMVSDRCPGELVGVFHCNGEQAARDWIEANPGWYERYREIQS